MTKFVQRRSQLEICFFFVRTVYFLAPFLAFISVQLCSLLPLFFLKKKLLFFNKKLRIILKREKKNILRARGRTPSQKNVPFALFYFQFSQHCHPSIEKEKRKKGNCFYGDHIQFSKFPPSDFLIGTLHLFPLLLCEILGDMHTWNCCVCEHTYHSWSVDWHLISTRYPQPQI